ncbi:hypothetical protein D3C76_1853140 [compost metagenome]
MDQAESSLAHTEQAVNQALDSSDEVAVQRTEDLLALEKERLAEISSIKLDQ